MDRGTNPKHQELMLDTDMCLAYDENIKYTECKKNSSGKRAKGKCEHLLSDKPLKAAGG